MLMKPSNPAAFDQRTLGLPLLHSVDCLIENHRMPTPRPLALALIIALAGVNRCRDAGSAERSSKKEQDSLFHANPNRHAALNQV